VTIPSDVAEGDDPILDRALEVLGESARGRDVERIAA